MHGLTRTWSVFLCMILPKQLFFSWWKVWGESSGVVTRLIALAYNVKLQHNDLRRPIEMLLYLCGSLVFGLKNGSSQLIIKWKYYRKLLNKFHFTWILQILHIFGKILYQIYVHILHVLNFNLVNSSY